MAAQAPPIRSAASMRRRRAYFRWRQMIVRCSDPSHPMWKYYGGRGITVCHEWSDSFDAYYTYVGDPPAPGLSIDRRDNDLGYEPGNVRWATAEQQSQNRRKPWRDVTHCPRDHPYDAENTYADRTGRRHCRTCRHARNASDKRAAKVRARAA